MLRGIIPFRAIRGFGITVRQRKKAKKLELPQILKKIEKKIEKITGEAPITTEATGLDQSKNQAQRLNAFFRPENEKINESIGREWTGTCFNLTINPTFNG